MCGICGIYKFDKTEILKNELVMNDTMIFRGPDDDGYFVNKILALL